MSRHARKWRWEVTCYYTRDPAILQLSTPGQRGAEPGQQAIQTVHQTAVSRDIEVSAAQNRPEIGRIIVVDLHNLMESDEWPVEWRQIDGEWRKAFP